MFCQEITLVITRLIICGIVVAFFSAVNAQPQTQSRQVEGPSLQSLYDAAQRSHNAGNLDQAAGEYRSFLANAQGELAAQYAAAGDFARAAALFKAALALEPDSPVLRLGYAKTALLMGNFSLAEAVARGFLNDALGSFEQIAQAHQILGRTLLKMNRDLDARAEMQKAVDLDASFDNRYDLAVVCLDQDDEKCAAGNFQALEQSFGDTPAIHMQFGLAYGNSDFASKAEDEFRKVIARNPRYPEAHYCLAATYLAENDNAKIKAAESELEAELEVSPNDFLTYAALGKVALAEKQYDRAATYLHRAIALNAKNPDAYLYLGQLEFEKGDLSAAEQTLWKSIQLTIDLSRNRYQVQKAHYLLGRILMREGKRQEAANEMKVTQSFMNRTLSSDQSKLAGFIGKPAQNSEGGDTPLALESTAAGGDTAPSASDEKESDPKTVHSVKAFDARISPAIADSYNNLGVILGLKKDYAAASESFANAAHWNSHLAGIDLNWGRAAFSASKFADAIPPLTRYVQSHPQDSNVRAPLGMSLYMTGDYRECLATLEPVVQQLASIPQIAYVYADSLVKTGRQVEGIERLEELEKQHPEIADVHRALSEAYKSTNQDQKAAAEMQAYNSLIAPSAATAPTANPTPAKNE